MLQHQHDAWRAPCITAQHADKTARTCTAAWQKESPNSSRRHSAGRLGQLSRSASLMSAYVRARLARRPARCVCARVCSSRRNVCQSSVGAENHLLTRRNACATGPVSATRAAAPFGGSLVSLMLRCSTGTGNTGDGMLVSHSRKSGCTSAPGTPSSSTWQPQQQGQVLMPAGS